jgi:DNA-binding transcriptional ArsR family regulator
MKTQASADEVEAYRALAALLRSSPIPAGEILANLSLYLTRSSLSQILFMSHLYSLILNVHGVVIEFGNRWGRNLALFSSLRNIFEPHNYGRKIVGFDTFSGFPSVAAEDGDDAVIKRGALSVNPEYQPYLDELLAIHERLSPRPELRRFETVKGDVQETVPAYLEAHPETIVALAYFDMDLYRPTKSALEAILPRLTKGSIIGFDELCVREFPGETTAFREVIDVSRCALVRSPYSNHQSYIVY